MAPSTEITPAWDSYVDLKLDVKPYLQMPSTDTARDPQLQMIADMCCTWVQNYLGRPVAPTEFFRRFSGTNRSYIELPYYPVLGPPDYTMTVVEYWGSSGPHTLAEQTPANQGTQDVYQMDYLRGTIIRSFMGLIQRPLFPGSRNIEVTWWAGYNPVPKDLMVATLELVAYWWRNTQQASRSGPLPRGMEGEYDSENPAMTPLWPAVPHRVIALLAPYLQIAIG